MTTDKISEEFLKNEKLSVTLLPKGIPAVLAAPADDAPEHVEEAAERNSIKFKAQASGSLDVRDPILCID